MNSAVYKGLLTPSESQQDQRKTPKKLSLSFTLSLGVNGPRFKSYIAASNEHVRSFNRLHSSSSRVLRKINFLNKSCDNLILRVSTAFVLNVAHVEYLPYYLIKISPTFRCHGQ